jgi:ABC-type transporter Mla subunit MlaD
MSRTEFHPAKLGAFVIGALLLGVMAAILWGPLSDLWQKRYVIFFDEPATGLDQGAGVRLNGVGIGKVDSVDLFFDPTQTNKVYSAVVVRLNPKSLQRISKGGQSFDDLLKNKEVSAQLGISGVISFKLDVELKIEPLKSIEYRSWNRAEYHDYFGDYNWIPARESTIAKMMEKLNDVLNTQGIPNLLGSLTGLMDTNNTNGLLFKTSAAMDSLHVLAGNVNETLLSNTNDLKMAVSNLARLYTNGEPNLNTVLSNLNGAVVSARATLDKVDAGVDKFGAGIDFVTNRLAGIQSSLEARSAELGVLLRGAAPLPPQMADTLRSLQEAIESLQKLIDYVELHPESLARGRAREK